MRAASVILGLAVVPACLFGCAASRADAPPAEEIDLARRRERPDMAAPEPRNPYPGKPRRGDKRADARP